jgi:hypothetical protein
MARAPRPHPMLVAQVAGELTEVPDDAVDEDLVRRLNDELAARVTWPGAWRWDLRELERLVARSRSAKERQKWEREEARTRRRLAVGASPPGETFLTAKIRKALESHVLGREPLLRLLELYAFDRLSHPLIYDAAPGLTASQRRFQLKRASDAASTVAAAMRRYQDCISMLEPETCAPVNDLAGCFAPHAEFARETMRACEEALPHFERVDLLLQQGLRSPQMTAHRRADTMSRLMALRVVATVSVAGLSDDDAIDALKVLHEYIRNRLAKDPLRGSGRVLANPVPQAKVDLEAFRAIRRKFTSERIRVGLSIADVTAALADAESGGRRARVP